MQTTAFVLVMNALVIACAVKTETWRMRIVSHALATQVEDIAMTYLPIRVFPDCRMVQYNTDKHICGCFWKQSVCKNSVCAICLEDFIIGESLTLCPCGHCYHKKCIRGWLRLKNCCPLCKVRVSRRPRVHNERTPLLYDDLLSV